MTDNKNPRPMPERINVGQRVESSILAPIFHKQSMLKNPEDIPNNHNYRMVMGYFIPEWQRPLVWTLDQKIGFIVSAWRGLNLGTYTYNQTLNISALDNILIDGQQRLHALECYLNDEFAINDRVYSELTKIERRKFEMQTAFSSYITKSDDEDYLKEYYNLTNFGGTAHSSDQRA